MDDLFFDLAAQMGWSDKTQVDMLLEYIKRQESDEAFQNFILEIKAQDEQDVEF
jgi:hypothetical protein